MVCEVATSEIIEKRATTEVCQLMKQYFPLVNFQPDCETAVTSVWDEVKAMCPRGKETFVTLPTPEEIEKLVCEVATSEVVEKEATLAACKLVTEKWPSISEGVCETLVEGLWNKIKELCPKGKETVVTFPSPAEIEKMVCEVATSEIIEKKATTEVCQLMKQYFPSVKFQPDCETAVTGVWDEVKALCPNGKETTASLPTPEEIEKMVCKV